jgi:hypothetical protein
MRGLLSFLAASVLSWVGWWVGKPFGFWIAGFLSLVGTAAGVYFARRFADEYLDFD